MIEKILHTIGNLIFPLKCGFGIGYGIGRKYQPIWISVSVSILWEALEKKSRLMWRNIVSRIIVRT